MVARGAMVAGAVAVLLMAVATGPQRGSKAHSTGHRVAVVACAYLKVVACAYLKRLRHPVVDAG
jgi:hypothetical protein